MATRRKAVTPEGSVLRACLDLLRFRGWPAWRFNSGSLRDPTGRPVAFLTGPDGRAYSGFSDLGAVVPRSGRWLAVEVKRPGGKPTAFQATHLDVIRSAGGVGVVVDDVAALARVLAALDADPWARFALDGGPEPCP